MPSYFDLDQGFVMREPTWHKREHAVLQTEPATFADARKASRLDWEVETLPVDVRRPLEEGDESGAYTWEQAEGYQALTRSDTGALLAVQSTSYVVIPNSAFGDIMDRLMGTSDAGDLGDRLVWEALFTLHGGRQVVALVRFENPAGLPWDARSLTYRFVSFMSRHDGNGGLRGVPTNVRTICANTVQAAEMTDGRYSGFTIRHTSNWERRVEEVAEGFRLARERGDEYDELMRKLSEWEAGARQREAFLKRWLPVSDADSDRKVLNTEIARDQVRRVLQSETCADISGTGYGLLMAATEWTDFGRKARSTDSAISRQLIVPSSHKTSAVRILKKMAGV